MSYGDESRWPAREAKDKSMRKLGGQLSEKWRRGPRHHGGTDNRQENLHTNGARCRSRVAGHSRRIYRRPGYPEPGNSFGLRRYYRQP